MSTNKKAAQSRRPKENKASGVSISKLASRSTTPAIACDAELSGDLVFLHFVGGRQQLLSCGLVIDPMFPPPGERSRITFGHTVNLLGNVSIERLGEDLFEVFVYTPARELL